MKTALVVGSTGIVGSNLASHLAKQKDWTVYGLARRATAAVNIQPLAADLLQPASLKAALQGIKPTHVYITTWMRQQTEAEKIRVNRAMVRNLLDALSGVGSVEHVALVTGLKHYLGPFEAYGRGVLPATPFREERPRALLGRNRPGVLSSAWPTDADLGRKPSDPLIVMPNRTRLDRVHAR